MLNLSQLRNFSATLICLSGGSHIALLWLSDINPPLLLSVLFGAVYLFIGIGLYGQSRFALVTAIIFPGLGAGLALANHPLTSFSTLGLGQLAVDAIVVTICSIVLFKVRKNPSI